MAKRSLEQVSIDIWLVHCIGSLSTQHPVFSTTSFPPTPWAFRQNRVSCLELYPVFWTSVSFFLYEGSKPVTPLHPMASVTVDYFQTSLALSSVSFRDLDCVMQEHINTDL